jgi:hypothetical protein
MIRFLRKIVSSGITGLVFAVGAALTVLYSNKVHKGFVIAFVVILTTYLLSIVFLFLRDQLKARTWMKRNALPVINEEVEHDWRVSENGDFSGRYTYSVKNVSDEDISVLPADDLLWFAEPTKITINFKVIESPRNNKITDYRNTILRYLFDYVFSKSVNSISWSHVIEPPLRPGESIKYQIQIETPETENDAFTESGAIAGIPASVPTKQAKLNYVAPNGYKFVILEPIIVVDNKGTSHPDEIADITGPNLSKSGVILSWVINNLKYGRRYWFKYKIVRE